MFKELTDEIEYHFKNSLLLKQALTHPSLSANNPQSKNNYERLEFLGDAVLNLVITKMLIEYYPEENEGNLAKRRSALVCGEAIVKVAQEIKLANYLLMSNGEYSSGGKNNHNNLENSLEGLIGALYQDGQLPAAEKFITKYWHLMITQMYEIPKDVKTQLQEWAQKSNKSIPTYNLIKVEGPAHLPLFTVELIIDNHQSSIGIAGSKKAAQRIAAANFLQKLNNKN